MQSQFCRPSCVRTIPPQLAGSMGRGLKGHELIAAAAGMAAFREFEKRQREQGNPMSHELAKTLLAGYAAAKIDQFLETKGRDMWDSSNVKEEAKRRSQELYDRYYTRRRSRDSDIDPEEDRERRHHHRRHRSSRNRRSDGEESPDVRE
ncbi:hypothetical protein ABW19_dt0200284 [Dactylella cylindrospora]|nr:hypothetical protein ABW19_dt0200284 [Dactylella cylindrospora]